MAGSAQKYSALFKEKLALFSCSLRIEALHDGRSKYLPSLRWIGGSVTRAALAVAGARTTHNSKKVQRDDALPCRPIRLDPISHGKKV